MKNRKTRIRAYILSALLLITTVAINAQRTTVTGRVVDATTNEPLLAATVQFQGTSIGTNTDFDGQFKLSSPKGTDTILISYLGYETIKEPVIVNEKNKVTIFLKEETLVVEDVVITVDKERYRNKDNPAVALIKKAIDQKSNNRAESFDFYEYEKYEKVILALNNVTEKFKNRRAFKKFQFLFEDMDTTKVEGEEVLPVYITESLSDVRYRKNPEKTKTIIKADTLVSFEGYGDNDAFNQYIDNLYQNINIYDNNVLILNQQFLSPIANTAPVFYKFYIQDTIEMNGQQVVELFFAPRNNLDIMFQGFIYISLDDNYSVAKLDMGVNPNISLNWVTSLNIRQEFKRDGENGYIQTRDEFAAEFGLTKKGMGIFGERIVSNKNVLVNVERPDSYYEGDAVINIENSVGNVDSFIIANRHETLTTSEAATYEKIDSLKNVKVFRNAFNILSMVLSGYTNVTPYFEIGPLNTFYSFNPIEGFRLRAGGRTRPEFSQRVEVETYAAYGFTDERWKGYLGVSYALDKGHVHTFPVNKIIGSYQYETNIPGQDLQFVQEDNVLLSIKRGVNDKYIYNKRIQFDYEREFENHFSYTVGYLSREQEPAGGLYYRHEVDGETVDVEKLLSNELTASVRWAPNEEFFQGKTYRVPTYNRFPKLSLHYSFGSKDLLKSDYDYQKIEFRLFKRFYLSRLGYSNLYFNAGTVLGQVPYPLLSIHAANQTYSYQLQGYNLMNFLEFLSDQYVSMNLEHNFNGFILNRIPLIRHLKLRESINIRVLYGGIRDENNPNLNTSLFEFPTTNGERTTFSLEEKPYVEGSIGLGNILKFFRVDLVKRFTYLENPNVTDLGIRVRFKIYF